MRKVLLIAAALLLPFASTASAGPYYRSYRPYYRSYAPTVYGYPSYYRPYQRTFYRSYYYAPRHCFPGFRCY